MAGKQILKCITQAVALVVVAGQQVDRQGSQRAEQFTQVRVLRRSAKVREIACDHHGMRLLGQSQDRLDRVAQIVRRVNASIGEPAWFPNMQVGDLQQQSRHIQHPYQTRLAIQWWWAI
jgi:hypothetical protein